MKKLTKKQRLQKAQNEHRKFLLSMGLNINTRNRVIIKQRLGTPFPDLSTVEHYKLSNNISGIVERSGRLVNLTYRKARL